MDTMVEQPLIKGYRKDGWSAFLCDQRKATLLGISQ